MILIPRRTWTAGLADPSAGKDPAWKSDGVTRRLAIPLPVSMLMVHYAGNADGIAPGNQFLSIDSRTYMRNMFMWAMSERPEAQKGDEYNYCVAGTEGTVYEWAGPYRAAHCSNWNDRSIGVQFGLDVDDVPPLAYAVRLLELRRYLVDRGVLTPDHEVDQHGQHFGTDCPGSLVKARWPMYDVALPAPQPPVNPKPLEAAVFVAVPDHPRYPTILVIYERMPGGKYINVSEADATFVARTRSGTDLGTWASSQPRVAYADLRPFLAEA